jgi:hypothetical protein
MSFVNIKRENFMKIKLLVTIILVLLLSCKTTDRYSGISYNESADGWLKRPTGNEFYFSEELDIPIIFIEENKINEAIILLTDVFYKKLTDNEYEYFTGKIKDEIENAYLVRSVNYAFNENGYKIRKSDKNNLLISHYTLGGGRRKGVQKWPIIILYEEFETINEIYTYYSVVK